MERVFRIYDGILAPGVFEFNWNGLNSDEEKTSAGFYYITVEADSEKLGVETHFEAKVKFLKIW